MTDRVPRSGLDAQGIATGAEIFWNLTTAPLVEHSVRRGEGLLANDGDSTTAVHRSVDEERIGHLLNRQTVRCRSDIHDDALGNQAELSTQILGDDTEL